MNAHHHAWAAGLAALVTLVLPGLALIAPVSAHSLAIAYAPAVTPIYVGQIVPLTGNLASGPGTYGQAGAKLAVR